MPLKAQVAARHIKVLPAPAEDDEEIPAVPPASVKFADRDAWIPRYRQWAFNVFRDPQSDTPTDAQSKVLLTVHFRAVKEEYELLGEVVPRKVWDELPSECNISKPLLRLIHGLPGSGKSKLLHWLKEYFDAHSGDNCSFIPHRYILHNELAAKGWFGRLGCFLLKRWDHAF